MQCVQMFIEEIGNGAYSIPWVTDDTNKEKTNI